MKYVRVALIAAIVTGGAPVSADILALPGGGFGVTKGETTVPRGASQGEILTIFGEPERRIQPVGEPAISSWDYGRFRIYFENGQVLHTVVAGP